MWYVCVTRDKAPQRGVSQNNCSSYHVTYNIYIYIIILKDRQMLTSHDGCNELVMRECKRYSDVAIDDNGR